MSGIPSENQKVLQEMSWEARLERARAQRESVLRAKAAESNEPKPLVDKSALRPPDPSEPAEGNAPPTTPADMFVFGPAPENLNAPKADPAAKPEPASKAAGTAGPLANTVGWARLEPITCRA